MKQPINFIFFPLFVGVILLIWVIAGVFAVLGLILAIISINQFLNNLNFLGLGNNEEMSSQLFIIVLVISLVSQVGDIIVSFFKS